MTQNLCMGLSPIIIRFIFVLMQLSKNFSLSEMTKSVTAKRLGIDNTPNEQQTEYLRELCANVLQPLRDKLGPILITSGLRVPELNKAVGGSGTSQHCALNGAAADIDMDAKNTEVFNYIKDNLVFDQLIWEFGSKECPDWVHVSYHYGHNRGQILKAIKQNGKTKYLKYED
jgi:zinc D-Ala-D-Ala carboxypeptidase